MKKILLLVLVFFLSLAFISCKKTPVNEEEQLGISSNSSLNGLRSNIKSADVVNWLELNKNVLTPIKNSTIEKLLQNLEFDKMYIEKFHGKEELIIIPLKKVYFSQHINLAKPAPIQYLILVENAEGKIRRSDMVLFYPKDANLTALPENSFSDFFNKDSFPEDGTFTLISLGDVKQYEMDFKDGKKSQFRLWQTRIAGDNGKGNGGASSLDIWINWYLVTTYYYTDGTVEVVETYLGQTCYSCGNGPNQTINDPIVDNPNDPSGNGFEGPTSRGVEFTVKRELTSYEDWEIVGNFTLNGITFNNVSNNIFTSITYPGTIYGASTIRYYSFLASTQYPSAPRYSIYNETSHSNVLLGLTIAHASINSTMYYPNLPSTYGSQNIFPYFMPKTWQASIDLF
jgi:hypothetical protein